MRRRTAVDSRNERNGDRRRRLKLENLEPRMLLAAEPIISELMAANRTTIDDGDGFSSDWIELYNAGDAPIDLTGHYLTDNDGELDKWPLPAITLGDGDYDVIFASGQAVDDYQDPAGYWHASFQLQSDGEYLALVAPDGETVLDEYAPSFPRMPEDISYGVAQAVSFTTLLDPATDVGRVLIPTAGDDAAIGSTWTGGAEPFDDSAWQSAPLGVGFDDIDGPPQQLTNVAAGKPVASSTIDFGTNGSEAVDGNLGNFTHTSTADIAPWLTIDLQEDFLVELVNVHTRGNCCTPDQPERDYNLYVEVLDASDTVLHTALPFNPWDGSGGGALDVGNGASFTIDLTGEGGGGVLGRKVRIRKDPVFTGSNWLSLAEVEVMADAAVEANLALLAPVTTSGPTWAAFPASLVTDGNPASFSHPGQVTQTNNNEHLGYWYQVDLGEPIVLGRIELFNRADGCCTNRLSNYLVEVLDGDGATVKWSGVIRPPGEGDSGVGGVDTVTFDMGVGAFSGQFVRVTNVSGIDYNPQIAELRVFGPDGYEAFIQTDVETEMLAVNASAYLRVPFAVVDAAAFDDLTLGMRYDDGFVAYLNGTEVARANAPAGTPAYDATATDEHVGGIFTEFDVPVGLLQTGDNVLAIHGLNLTAADTDFLIQPTLTARAAPVGQRGFFVDPTPGEPNGGIVSGFVDDTRFDVDRGFYDTPFDVRVTTDTPGATLVYTTDGTPPTLTNGTVVPPADADTPPLATVHVATTTTLRAAAFKEGLEPTNVDTHTYIFLQDVIRQATDAETGAQVIPDGLPAVWQDSGTITADYQMDPDVVDDPDYADEIIDGLRSIPTISIVMDPDDLWSTESGIYMKSSQRGRAWEHPTSVEIIEPDGTSFQADSGIRIHGFSWRHHSNSPKHGFRLEFRDEYGPSKLEYPLFPDAPVDKFDSIVLRQQGGRAWAGLQVPAQAQYLRDTYARDLAREMGAVDGHATLVHLYLNGLYWGLYNPVERPNAQMGEEYFGGSDEDYDALNRRTSSMEVIDGDMVRYNEMLAIVNNALAAGVTTDQDYADLQRYLAMDDFIDFMIRNQYVTNRDGVTAFEGNNQRAIGSRVGDDAQFRFFVWDMEYSMWNATDNAHIAPGMNSPALAGSNDPANGIWAIYKALIQHPEFLLRYGDHVQKHLFHDGALTPEKAAATYNARAESIYTAIIGESARWGDAKRTTPYTRDVEWMAEWNRFQTSYFPQRTDVLIGQYTAAGLYPSVAAPEFLVDASPQHGGPVAPGAELSIILSDDTNYIDTTLLAQGAATTALVPIDDSLGLTWTATAFDDASWLSGVSGVGYEQGTGYGALIGLDVETEMAGVSTSVLARVPFSHDDSTTFDELLLEMQYDDGFVAYLNGTEVARSVSVVNDVPGTATATSHEAGTAEPFDITAFEHLLLDGVDANVLAIHGINISVGSSDMLALPELVGREVDTNPPTLPIYVTTDGSDPRLTGGDINPTATLYSSELLLNESTLVRARALDDGAWSAVNEAFFTVHPPADATNVAVGEVNYHPYAPTAAELAINNEWTDDDFEFVELVNTSGQTIDLDGAQITDGVTFDFSLAADPLLLAGERVLVVRNEVAFEARYGTSLNVAGQYSGGLSNGGERVELVDRLGGLITAFTYDDTGAWPGRSDGNGSALEVVDTSGNYDDPNNWRSSSEYGGSPGAVGVGPRSDVVVNEVLSNSDAPGLDDAIELLNTTGGDIDLGGWVLSDSSANYRKFEFPAGTTIHAGEYLVLTEADFNPAVPDPGQTPFALDGAGGDDVWLLETHDVTGALISFVEHVDFGAAGADESLGRWPDGTGPLYPMAERTFGATNTGPRIGPVVFGEVMYSPTEPTAGELTAVPAVLASDFEFVELFNPSPQVLDLGGWRLDNAVDFVFPPGTMLRPGDALVVLPFDPINDTARLALWQARYPAGSSDALHGPWTGRLNNAGETLQLERPDPPVGDPPATPWILVDEVRYEPTTPWPAADATGASLDRAASNAFGNNATSWTAAATPTPGVSTLTYTSAVVGEHVFYANSVFAATSDDAAIATDKTALRPGETATSANYTSFSAGINGLMIDVAQLPDDGAALAATDFAFRIGNDNAPAGWTPIASPTPVVRLDEGVDGGDRIVFTWPDETITNTWLEVTVRATPATGLAADEVVYFGNAIGETGNDASNALVTAADLIAIRDNGRGLANRATITNPHDINRDAQVNATDALMARNNVTGPFDTLRLIDL